MNFILQRMLDTEEAQRPAELERILRVFPEKIPAGGWEPGYIWPSKEEVEERIAEGCTVFTELERIMGGVSPAVRAAREKFEDEARQMRKLTLAGEKRGKLPAHEFFPLYGRFNESFHSYMRAHYTVRLNDLTFTTKLLGKGGFADVYKAKHTDGALYALKLFHVQHQLSTGNRMDGEINRMVSRLMDNLRENFKLFDMAQLAKPVFVPSPPFKWYVLEYAPGRTVKSMMRRGTVRAEDAGRAMLTYAQMLSSLHEKQMCFVDNNWGAVMVGTDNVRIVDYDLASSVEKLASDDLMTLGTPIYASREHHITTLPFLPPSDLEGFALMIDHLLFGQPFIKKDKDGFAPENYAAVQRNQRSYPRERAEALPQNLRQIVVPLITYPRDESLTAEDFVSAIKADYRL